MKQIILLPSILFCFLSVNAQNISLEAFLGLADEGKDTSKVFNRILNNRFNYRSVDGIKNYFYPVGPHQSKKPTETVLVETEGPNVKFIRFLTTDPAVFQSFRNKILECGCFYALEPFIQNKGELSELFAYEDYYLAVYSNEGQKIFNFWVYKDPEANQ